MQMLDLIPTAPFGSRRLSVIALKAQRAVRNCPAGMSTHKWKTFRHICEAKVALGLSDRALAILNALLSFHPETTLVSGGRTLVVFPSNRELALRAHGLAASTLRRHLALLVDTGLIVRRDSPNGKRYARKTAAGEIERAFGLDLSPLVVRAKELAGLAAAITRDRHAAAMLREQITVARRDVARMIAMGIEQGVEADWPQLHQAFRQLLERRAGQQSRQELEELGAELTTMANHIRTILESQLQVVDPVETSTRDDRSPCKDNADSTAPSSGPALAPAAITLDTIPVRLVAEICPDFVDYARDGLRSARDVVDTAALVRPLLGVSPSAWEEACAAMGPAQASVTLALVLQRGSAIKNPGGYLRTLARRAGAGKFSFWPMLLALGAGRHKTTAAPPSLSFPEGST